MDSYFYQLLRPAATSQSRRLLLHQWSSRSCSTCYAPERKIRTRRSLQVLNSITATPLSQQRTGRNFMPSQCTVLLRRQQRPQRADITTHLSGSCLSTKRTVHFYSHLHSTTLLVGSDFPPILCPWTNYTRTADFVRGQTTLHRKLLPSQVQTFSISSLHYCPSVQ